MAQKNGVQAHFHTIKSILNQNLSFDFPSRLRNFHTIKSILNTPTTVVTLTLHRHFHTIKSILNRDEKSLKPAKKS